MSMLPANKPKITIFPPGELPKVEVDPNGIAAKQPGAKLDAGKAPVWQGVLDYFPRSVIALANLSGAGASKYSWKGWESVPDGENRYRNAAARHAVYESIEGLWDSDMKSRGYDVLHQTQKAWNEMAALELMLRRLEKENVQVSKSVG